MFQNNLSMLSAEESETNVISFIAGDFLDGSRDIDENWLKNMKRFL